MARDLPQVPEGFDWRAITPDDSPKTPVDVLADPRVRALATPEVVPGGPAYGFSRPLYDFSEGRKAATLGTFDLLETARRTPVALIFGSYT